MEISNQKKNKKGQTLLEIIAVLVIIGVILAAVIPAVTASTDNGRVQSAVSSIRTLQTAATSYYNDNNGTYAGISIAGLASKYLPSNFSGSSANPWNGNIGIAENGTTTNQFVVSLDNVPATAQNPLDKALQNTSISTNYSGTTYKVTLS